MFKKIIFEKIVRNEIFCFVPDFGEKSICLDTKYLKKLKLTQGEF